MNSPICEACPNILKEYYTKDNKKYCPDCYDIIHATQCIICLKYPKAYKLDPFWKIGYCSEHEKVQHCVGCGRIRSKVAQFTDLPDCGCICSDCAESAVVTNEDATALFHRVSEFWASKGFTLPQHIPVYTVGSTKMHCIRKEEKSHETRTLGLTFSNKSVVTRFLVSKSKGNKLTLASQTDASVESPIVDIQITRHVQGRHQMRHFWLRYLLNFRNSAVVWPSLNSLCWSIESRVYACLDGIATVYCRFNATNCKRRVVRACRSNLLETCQSKCNARLGSCLVRENTT